jgi:hypothetical protein
MSFESAKERKQALEDLKESCLSDLWTYAQVIEPHRCYGEIHKKLFKWWQHKAGENSLCLLPRDHQKSHCMAVLTSWLITRDPSITILYISATSYLAQQQLRDIKNILTSKIYRTLWPEMVNEEEGQREKWTNTEICVDHPLRKAEGVRDSTVFTAGLTTNTTGLHCKAIMKDDVVVPDNAYTEEGRRSTAQACSQLASILTTGGMEYAVGTRYHPKDYYDSLKEMKEEVFNDEGEVIDQDHVYRIFEHQVETAGKFLWPKQFRAEDGKAFGFNHKELARKKAKYLDSTQFYAQYYNNPNDMENARLDRSRFQYYNREQLVSKNGIWSYHGNRLNVYAAVDFAYSTAVKADYTCILVIGVDYRGDIYVLDINRFKTNKMETYFQNILDMYNKWEFLKVRAEVTAAQDTIAQYIQDRAKDLGMGLKVDKFRPNRYQGSKEERIQAILEPRYENQEIWHYKGGYTAMLEEELLQSNPRHDDLKDCLASACSMEIKRPRAPREGEGEGIVQIQAHPRFGGVKYA